MWKIIKWFLGILFVLFIIGSLMYRSAKRHKSIGTSGDVGKQLQQEPLRPEPPETAPSKPGGKRFGGGVIRKEESGEPE